MRVALICMPFQNFALPSLGLGLLQAALRAERVRCDVHYLNLRFASRIGCVSYLKLGVNSPQDTLAGEWLFAGELFEERRRSQSYVETIVSRKPEPSFQGATLRRLLAVKRVVPRFLDECFGHVAWGSYDVIGFTSTFQQNVASLALAKRVKAAFPDELIVFGGANCEGEMGIELHRQFSFVDFVCMGEGDRAFPELIRQLMAGKDGSEIPGIVSRLNGTTVIPREIVSPIFDLDTLPYPCYDDYFAQLDNVRLNRRFAPNIPYETSRGCWWGEKMHCTFCGLNGSTMAYRSKTPERAWEELKYLGKKYGTKIHCADNILDLKYFDSFFPRIASSKTRFSIQYETKLNLTKPQLHVLRQAGVRRLQPGIESLSTPVLKLMKKGCNLLQVVQFLKWSRQFGIHAIWNILYGFPGETASHYEEMARVIPLLAHLDPPIDMGRIRLDRFSPYFAHPESYGFRKMRPRPCYSFVYPFAPEVLARLAYSFEADHSELEFVEEYLRPVARQVKLWQSARSRGRLKGTLRGHDLLLEDTRLGKKRTTVVLPEPLRTAYIYCDQARPLSAIQALVSACFSRRENRLEISIEPALADLVSRGLMLKEGKSYLSLAILPVSNAGQDLPVVAAPRQDAGGEHLVQLVAKMDPPWESSQVSDASGSCADATKSMPGNG
jgi:ribosomal peptide maturation radical SAM protein 1